MVAQQVKELDNARLAKVQALESKLGCCVVALQQPPIARLSQTQLQELQAMEKELSVTLIAYAC